jgi:hypothetical protein
MEYSKWSYPNWKSIGVSKKAMIFPVKINSRVFNYYNYNIMIISNSMGVR